MQKIVTNLWFDGRVEEALEFYTSVFPNARVKSTSRYGNTGPRPKGEILVAIFELEGQEFAILNGGPGFPHSPAVSLLFHCDNQAEIDRLWDRLGDGGSYDQCGWLTDRFGISWQICPASLGQMLTAEDETKRERVMNAILSMQKLDIAALEGAYHSD